MRLTACWHWSTRWPPKASLLHHIDLGGGVGIRYRDETPPDLAAYGRALAARFAGRHEKLLLEPGRSLVGNAGLLLTRVEYLKPGEDKNFAIVDAAMNDLMRPALYEAYHEIVAVNRTRRARQALRHRRPDLRNRRFSWLCARSCDRGRRPAGPAFGRRLRHEHGFELQFPPASRRNSDRQE